METVTIFYNTLPQCYLFVIFVHILIHGSDKSVSIQGLHWWKQCCLWVLSWWCIYV